MSSASRRHSTCTEPLGEGEAEEVSGRHQGAESKSVESRKKRGLALRSAL